MPTLVYLNGGDKLMGELEDRELREWKKYGRERDMKYLYKGYHFYDVGVTQLSI